MLINNKNWHTIWFNENTNKVEVIDQRKLPHNFSIKKIIKNLYHKYDTGNELLSKILSLLRESATDSVEIVIRYRNAGISLDTPINWIIKFFS